MNKLLLLASVLSITSCSEPSSRSVATAPKAPTATASQAEKQSVAAPAERPAAGLTASEDALDATASEFGSAVAKAHPEQAEAMLAAAQKTFEATNASYEVGTNTLNNLQDSSRRLMLAQRALADNKEQDLAALLDYWKRSKKIYLKVRALYNAGTRGGETEKFHAASYFLAEAELLLVAAGGTVPEEIE